MAAADEPDDLSAPPPPDSLLQRVALTVAPPASRPPLALPPGRKLGERYVILRPLGSGGMGEVYLARDVTLQREVAIKRHRHGREVERLRREAIAMARLAHPNVVTVFEVGELDGGVYVAMEYVPGTTLRVYLAERRRSPRELRAMLRAIGEGLAAAHDAGIVHRDFKPENVLIGRDGRARITDFGLARDARAAVEARPPARDGADASSAVADAGERGAAIGSEDGARRGGGGLATSSGEATPALALASTLDGGPAAPAAGDGDAAALPGEPKQELTAAGTVMGTPAYMAPEQATGGTVDVRADQFAFCMVAWEALFGVRPRAQPAGASSGLLASPGGEREAGLGRGRTSRRLRAALLRGLAEDPAQRHPSLRALLDELAERRPWRAIALGAAALATAALATWQLTREAPLRCDGVGDEIAALEAPLLVQLTGLGRGAAAAHLTVGLDQFRRDYRAAAAATCRARRDQGWSEELYLRARGCLAVQRRLAMAQLAAVDSDGRGVPGGGAPRGGSPAERAAATAMAAAGRALPLPNPAGCEDPLQLTGAPEPPAGELETVAAARAAIELARRSLEAGDAAMAGARLDEVTAAAASHPYVAARLALVRALQAIGRGALGEGEAQLAAVHAAARAGGDVETQLFATAASITAAGELRLDRAAAERHLTTAIAEAEMLGGLAPEAAARVYLAAARVARDEPVDDAAHDDARRSDDGEGSFGGLHTVATTRAAERALSFLARAARLLGEGRPRPLHLDLLQLRAAAHLATGRFGDARADHQRALEQAHALLGSDHPRVAWIAAGCAEELGQVPVTEPDAAHCAAEAARILALPSAGASIEAARASRALGRYRIDREGAAAGLPLLGDAERQLAALGVADLERAELGVTLGLAYNDAHRPEEARPLLEGALAIQERVLPAGHAALGTTLYNLAVVQRDREQPLEASRHARRAAEIFAAHRAADSHRLALALVAQLANRAGDSDAALAATAEALRWRSGSDPISLAWPQLERARALLTKGGAPRQAQQLLLTARMFYEMVGLRDRIAEIDRLLAKARKQGAPPI